MTSQSLMMTYQPLVVTAEPLGTILRPLVRMFQPMVMTSQSLGMTLPPPHEDTSAPGDVAPTDVDDVSSSGKLSALSCSMPHIFVRKGFIAAAVVSSGVWLLSFRVHLVMIAKCLCIPHPHSICWDASIRATAGAYDDA